MAARAHLLPFRKIAMEYHLLTGSTFNPKRISDLSTLHKRLYFRPNKIR